MPIYIFLLTPTYILRLSELIAKKELDATEIINTVQTDVEVQKRLANFERNQSDLTRMCKSLGEGLTKLQTLKRDILSRIDAKNSEHSVSLF